MLKRFPIAIRVKVPFTDHVRENKPARPSAIVPTAQIIQSGFLVVDVSTITERITLAQRRCQTTTDADALAPWVIFVFYHQRTRIVKHSDDISL